RDEIGAVIDLLAGSDEELAEACERALSRIGEAAATAAIARFEGARAPLRGRLARLVGRIAQDAPKAEHRAYLISALDDDDPRTPRSAASALGKVGGDGVEDALLRRWGVEPAIEQRRALASALGKVGGARALEAIRALSTDDRELARIAAEAR